MEKEKGNKLFWVVILLTIILIGLIVFITCKVISDNKENNENDTSEVESEVIPNIFLVGDYDFTVPDEYDSKIDERGYLSIKEEDLKFYTLFNVEEFTFSTDSELITAITGELAQENVVVSNHSEIKKEGRKFFVFEGIQNGITNSITYYTKLDNNHIVKGSVTLGDYTIEEFIEEMAKIINTAEK